ncbi:MAG: hypothetical protein ACYCSO_00290 [Cuniculiplasma sp.]
MEINLDAVLLELSKSRPIFHGESDFQFSLAWKIKSMSPEIEVRLEVPFLGIDQRRIRLDILCKDQNGTSYGIELKYFTRKLVTQCGDESFKLRDRGAIDHQCFDSIKDIQRLEGLVDSDKISVGYTVWLTNDKSIWERSWERSKKSAFYEQFRLFEGREIKGRMDWGEGTSLGTKKGRNYSLSLIGTYKIAWYDYSNMDKCFKSGYNGNDLFRYSLTRISNNRKNGIFQFIDS